MPCVHCMVVAFSLRFCVRRLDWPTADRSLQNWRLLQVCFLARFPPTWNIEVLEALLPQDQTGRSHLRAIAIDVEGRFHALQPSHQYHAICPMESSTPLLLIPRIMVVGGTTGPARQWVALVNTISRGTHQSSWCGLVQNHARLHIQLYTIHPNLLNLFCSHEWYVDSS